MLPTSEMLRIMVRLFTATYDRNAKTTETPALLSTLAHEYKHILQSFVERPEGLKGGKVFNAKNEVDACIFGQFKTRAFCFGEWYVLKSQTSGF